MNTRRTLIFDLDGTLVDTAPDLAAAMNAVLIAAGRPELSLDTVRHLVGRGARTLIARGFETTGGPIAPEKMDGYLTSFLAHYRENIASSDTFPQVRETLGELHKEAALGIATSKPQELADMLLEKIGLAHLFGYVHGAGRTPYVKPDPRHYTDVVAALGGAPARSLMVGDSVTDVELARAAGVPVILVSYGYTSVHARELGADAVVDHFAEIHPLIRKLLP